MKPGDLVRWRTNGDTGIVLSAKEGSLIGGDNVLHIMWFTGEPTGPLPDDHACLELISEAR
jgi:hypothetical protein